MPRHREACIPPAEGVTVYQGKKRCIGQFRCDGCRRTWSSRNSWRDTYQSCFDCHSKVYPHSQRKLDASTRTKDGPPHDEENCGMCQRLGFNCTTVRVSGECNYSCNCGNEWHDPRPGPMRCASCKTHVHRDDASSEDSCDDLPQWQTHSADAELGRDYARFQAPASAAFSTSGNAAGGGSPASGYSGLLFCLWCC